jgi:hypothetical protein
LVKLLQQQAVEQVDVILLVQLIMVVRGDLAAAVVVKVPPRAAQELLDKDLLVEQVLVLVIPEQVVVAELVWLEVMDLPGLVLLVVLDHPQVYLEQV